MSCLLQIWYFNMSEKNVLQLLNHMFQHLQCVLFNFCFISSFDHLFRLRTKKYESGEFCINYSSQEL